MKTYWKVSEHWKHRKQPVLTIYLQGILSMLSILFFRLLNISLTDYLKGEFPENWGFSLIVPLHKKGDTIVLWIIITWHI